MIKFTLPMSPSVNAMYRHHGHITYKTAEAKMWIKSCEKCIGRHKTIRGHVDVELRFFLQREADLDNRIKSLLDVLQEYKVIENDKQVYSILATKDFDKKQPRVEVRVIENE